MANINEFKIIKQKSRKLFDYLGLEDKEISEIEKERIGFYNLILENIIGTIDLKEGEEEEEETYFIIDKQYNHIVKGRNDVDDLGIDVVYIKNEDSEVDIKLFNFKYRENFNIDKTKSESDISRSTKFLDYIIQGKELDENINPLVHKKINSIINHLKTNKVCKITLYMVSNEAKGFSNESNEYIKILEKNYGMVLKNISLDEIINFFNEKKENRKSTFVISSSEFLSFQNDEKSTQKSYILKLSLIDLIRITCNDEELSNDYSIEEDEKLLNTNLDFSLLYDNVRGFLGETKYNLNILETLRGNNQYFFMFNNGITLTAEKIECSSINSGVKYLFTIENFQIVNGGQTIRSIYNFLNDNTDNDKIKKLRESHVLLRIFKTNKADPLKNAIAEYTNSQNAISDIDLKSIDQVQIELERYLTECDILYIRKAGDLNEKEKTHKFRISMEKMAQILYSAIGYPDRASNQKRRLFQDYYNDIFKSKNFSLEVCKELAEKYNEIEEIYKNTNYKFSDQKIFYIIYLTTYTSLGIEKSMEKLEELLNTYDSKNTLAKRLTQKGFKDYVNSNLEIQ